MDQVILYAVTMIVTWLLGILAKRYKYIDVNLIPLQNLFIGVLVMGAEWLITKDINAALAMSGLMAGGAYDLVHNFNKLVELNTEEKLEQEMEELQTVFNEDAVDEENLEEE